MGMQKWQKDRNKPFRMKASREGRCAECEEEIIEGDAIVYDPTEYKAYCETCGEELL